jgi:hypothetical protein
VTVRYEYKINPQPKPHPAFPNQPSWSPYLEVRLSNPARSQSDPTPRFEALVDTGCADTLFHASIGIAIGLDIEAGIEWEIAGIVKRSKAKAYFHDVDLHVDASIIRIRAGFCHRLPVAGLLGRRGFFEHFIVKFDPTLTPPGFALERAGRA